MNRSVPLFQRPALWVAVVALALLAIGFAGSRISSSNKSDSSMSTQPAAQAEPSETPDGSQANTTNMAEPDQVDTASDPTDNAPPQAEVALEKKNIEKPEKKDDNEADHEPAIAEKTAHKAQPRQRGARVREVVIERDPLDQPLPERPRIVRRREPVYGPPASSIETIFTGVPPEYRRRWRRIYP
jgi:hypothetical protein